MKAQLEITQAWLETCYQALCRRVPGGIIAHSAKGPNDHGKLLIVHDEKYRDQAEAEAQLVFGSNFETEVLVSDLATDQNSEALSLRRVLSELQAAVLEPGHRVAGSDTSNLVSFLLKVAGYRSSLIPLHRVIYHLTPDGEGWRLKRRDDDWEQLFNTKEEGVKEGARLARSHTRGQLIIHKANGQFEEERTYGDDPPGRG
tara:strand:- start:303 stop:905 length:603 start_codon:yes stop_codon:yes gene_type:complete